MSEEPLFTQLNVQPLPGAGLLVRFQAKRVLGESQVYAARDELFSLVAPERILLLDLSNIVYLSSTMLGVFIRLQRHLREQSGEMSLCGLPPDIAEVFRITKLDKTFHIYANLESALSRDGVGTW